METAQISGLMMHSLMVAAFLLFSHRPAMAEDSQLTQGVLKLTEPSENARLGCYYFVRTCARSLGTSCITDCCEAYISGIPDNYKCACWFAARAQSIQALATLQDYCGFTTPTIDCPQPPVAAIVNSSSTNNLQVMGKASNSSPPPPPQSTCCAKDREKIQSCMLNTASIDECCPTFKIMLGNNCNCYNFAKNLDNQALITLESYCDVTNPCKSSVQDS